MAGTELDRLYYTVDYDLGPAMEKAKQLDGVSKTAGENISGHFKKAASGAEELHRGIEINRRELLYFGREAMTGDLARLPSTLLLIGTHMSGLTSQGILMGGAIVAPFAAMAVSAYQAEMAIDRVGRAIAASGNAAGVNKGQMFNLASDLARTNGNISQRGALDVEAIGLGHGRIPGKNMGGFTQAAYGMQSIQGGTLDKAATDLEGMMKNPAKAAQDLHDNFNLLTDAQLHDIKGMKDRAAQEMAIFKAIADRGKTVEDSMWSLSKAFDKFSTFMSGMWFNTSAAIVGKPKTPAQQYLDARMQAQSLQERHNRGAWAVSQGDVNSAWHRAGDLHWQMMDANKREQAAAKKKTDDDNAADARSPAAMELQKLRDEARVNSAGPRDREMMRVRLEANRQYTINSNSTEPGMASRAGAIRDATINYEWVKERRERSDALTNVQKEAAGQEAIANAYRTSTQAGMEMTAQVKAEAESRKGAINNVNAYRDALLKSADAERTEAQIKENMKASDSNAVLALEVSLLKTDESIREKRVALLRAELELKEKGIKVGSREYQQAMANAAQAAELAKNKRDIGDEQQRELSVGREYTDMLGSIFDHANQGAKGLKTLLPDLTQSMLKMIEKLAILNPLENAMTGQVTGTKGKLPTFGSAGNLFNTLGGQHAANSVGGRIGGILGNMFGGNAAHGSMPGGGKGGSGGNGGGNVYYITQQISVHPDVSAIAKGEIMKAMPHIQASAVQALDQSIKRGFTPGGMDN